MKKIFCKSTEKRKKELQIYTTILVENGRKYVKKEPVYEEGKRHVDEIYENYVKLSRIYSCEVVECKKVGNGVVFPFIEGRTFDKVINDKISFLESENEWNKMLKEWKRLLIGDVNNIISFDNNTQFRDFFGDGQELLNDSALRITNFDCTSENIILTEQGTRLIDYEWVFDFPVPFEFSFFRVLKIFYLNNHFDCTFDELLRKAGIADARKIELYEKFIDKFDMYISYDARQDILYENLGKVYKIGDVVQPIEDYNQRFKFPDVHISQKSKVVLYGAGEVGVCYYKYFQSHTTYDLVAWIDKKSEKYVEKGYDVKSVDDIDKITFDYILIAIYNDEIAHEIIDQLVMRGISQDRILWEKPRYI